MNSTELRDFLKTVLTDLPEDDGCNLWDSGVMDSLAVVSLVSALEERYAVQFDAEHLRKENFESVTKIGFLLERLGAGKR